MKLWRDFLRLNKQNAWMLHRRAKTYAVLPSDLMGIEDAYSAYCFDEAIEVFGTMVDGLLKQTETKGSGKDKKVVQKYKTVRAAIREAVRIGSGVKVSEVSKLLQATGNVVKADH